MQKPESSAEATLKAEEATVKAEEKATELLDARAQATTLEGSCAVSRLGEEHRLRSLSRPQDVEASASRGQAGGKPDRAPKRSERVDADYVSSTIVSICSLEVEVVQIFSVCKEACKPCPRIL